MRVPAPLVQWIKEYLHFNPISVNGMTSKAKPPIPKKASQTCYIEGVPT